MCLYTHIHIIEDSGKGLTSLDQDCVDSFVRFELIITAPHTGRVSASTLSAGQAVQPGQTLVSLVPEGKSSSGGPGNPNSGGAQPTSDLQAQLFAPSRTAGFVEVGQEVWLRYAAFPYQKFGMARGEVIAVSRSPIAPQDLPAGQAQALVAAAQANEPMYRITVRLPLQAVNTYGKPTRLAAGMSLDADVRQDCRRVWEWLLEPALAVAGKNRILSNETKSSPGG